MGFLESDRNKQYIIYNYLNIESEEDKHALMKNVRVNNSFIHPNIIQMKDFYKTRDLTYHVVQEYSPYGSLADKINNIGKDSSGVKEHMEEEYILKIFKQLCYAVEHCHKSSR